MANPFAHVELMTGDVDTARKFYSEIFDWNFEENQMEGGVYWLIDTGIEPKGGIMALPEPDVPPHWLVYTKVDDVAAKLVKVVELGGTIVVDNTPIPDMGSFGIFQDPTGGVMAIWEEPEKE
jgi:predicted enzyme related to lactoylglutathione lyase